MFGSVVLDVAIGLVLVYCLLSLIATAVQESIAGYSNLRGAQLENGLAELLHDPGLVAAVYEHPLISSLYRGSYADARANKKLPAYIPSKSFSGALLDIAVRGRDMTAAKDAGPEAAVLSAQTLRTTLARLESKPVQRMMLTALDLSNNDLAKVQTMLESWFDASMDRVSGWYKRQTQRRLLMIGFAMAVIANVDSIRLANRFYADPSLRAAAVAMAQNVVKDTAAVQSTNAKLAVARLDSLRLPIGWNSVQFDRRWFSSFADDKFLALQTLLGWMLTALAISLGAPFWFDLLNKFMMVRGAVKPKPEESKDPSDAAVAAAAGARTTPVAVVPTLGTASVATAAEFEPHEWASGYPQGGIL